MKGPRVLKPGFGVEREDFVPLLQGGRVSENSHFIIAMVPLHKEPFLGITRN